MSEKLHYEVVSASSFTGDYVPEKILQHEPSNSSSRWTTETNDHPQYIVLKLSQLAFVRSITFGKYEKAHVCNVKKFEVYGGVDEQCSVKLLGGHLRNDSSSESFNIKNLISGQEFPVLFIKIMPIQSWGSSFNYSIWYVELRGNPVGKDSDAIATTFEEFRHQMALKLCLKYLRELGLSDCFESVANHIAEPFESPVVSDLFQAVVEEGNFERAEKIMTQCVAEGYMNDFVSNQKYVPVWQQITPASALEPFPGMRGGHQMVIDPVGQALYMMGGWDGMRNLSDFWRFDIATSSWTLLSQDTEEQGGPSARSCHKMILFPDEQVVFCIGRYVDQNARVVDVLKNDFYLYEIARNKWTKISDDTASEGGPRLLFDHQLAIDCQAKTIYVFGGRIIEGRHSEETDGTLSGLYSFHIPSNTWKCLMPDVRASQVKNVPLRPRIGHCLIFHPATRLLYIFGGHHNKEQMKDMIAYDVDNKMVKEICNTDTGDMVPIGFTQRASLDVELNEIYVYFGVTSDIASDEDTKDSVAEIQNTLWICDVATRKWSLCYRTRRDGHTVSAEPVPRYAHQFVYDSINKVHYLFGGNPTKQPTRTPQRLRLNDFWKLKLVRPKGAELIRRVCYLLRKQRYRELCASNSTAAVGYLQKEVRQVVDFTASEEIHEFHNLPALLFVNGVGNRSDRGVGSVRGLRNKVFEELCHFFPDHMVPPRKNLIDLVRI